MEKTSITFDIRRLKNFHSGSHLFFSICLVWLVVFNPTRTLQAQCSMACNSLIQVSLDANCQATVTAAMMLNDSSMSCPNGQFTVRVLKYDIPIPTSPVVTGAYVGETLKVEIRDNISGNRCWGYAKIEDKLPPTIECKRDTIPCFLAATHIPKVYDACDDQANQTNIKKFLDNFESYSVGSYLGLSSNKWTTWGGVEGGAEDTRISNEKAHSGTKSIKLIAGGLTDVLLPFEGQKTNGVFNLNMWMYVVNGSGAYFNIQANETVGQIWTVDVYFNPNGSINLFGGGNPIPTLVTYPKNSWFPVRVVANLTSNSWAVFVDNIYVGGWTAVGKYNAVASLDLYPINYIGGDIFYVDDVSYSYDPPAITPVLIDEIITLSSCDPRSPNYNPDYIKQIVRKYQATDSHGNKSPVCADTILLRRFDPNHVICPLNWDVQNNVRSFGPINCKDIVYKRIPLDKKGHPDPSYTGVPRYWDIISTNPYVTETIDLWPVRDIYCNVSVNYEDIDLGTIACVQKIMRMWTIREWWCNTETVRTCAQIIEIVDDEAPYVHAPYDFDATTDGGYKCQATVTIPPAVVFDSCGNFLKVDLVYPGGILSGKNGGTVVLPVGRNVIYYRAYDKCYNLGVDSLIVNVADKTAPVAICDRETVVSLSIYGTTHVYAKTFDDGSYDDCHIDSFLVRRMDNGAPCGQNITWFRPYVEFCCADVGQTRTVIFRVKDKHGNYNDCMVQIEVQDKIKPTCTPPKDLTVSCDFHFDVNAPDSLAIFGVMQRDSAYFNNPRKITYKGKDGVPVTIKFHDGFAHDNCDFTIDHSFVDNRTQCNVGNIVRTWVVKDKNNGSSICTQTITFVNFSPFNFDSTLLPRDTVLYGCLNLNELTPEVLKSKPIFYGEDKCDLVGLSYDDQVFKIVQGQNGNDACFKIVRTWKGIDWCQVYYDAGGAHFKTYTHVQIIKIHNKLDPIVTTIPQQDTTVCTLDSCTSGFISLIGRGSDDCTVAAELAWEYLIDAGNNGTFDIIKSGVGNLIDASGRYPLGTHKIKYVFEDRCGNKTAVERLFTILNCKEPTPYCINGVAIDLMPLDTNRDGRIDWGMIEVWASDVDQGSYGACKNPIVLSFSRDTNIRSIVFDCDSLGQKFVNLWVTDRLTGKQSFCRTFVEVQDNNKACSGGTLQGGTINGLISNREDNQSMNDVEVSLVDQNAQGKPTISKVITTNSGKYAFANMPLNNGNYNVIASRNADPLNGVSTADIVKIQRHILGIETLASPYKTIAADVNNDLNITSKDIVELRRLILGINSKFSNNESWAFLDANYQFASTGDDVLKEKWPRSYKIDPFNKDMNGIDFKGIKIGDITGNATAGYAAVTTRTNNSTLDLIAPEMSFAAGVDVLVPVSVLNNQGLSGMQFTIQFDSKVLEFVDIQSASCNINQENLGFVGLSRGLVTLSWNTSVDFDVNGGDKLFTLKFKALSQGNLSNALQFNSNITPALAFNSEVEDMDLKLGFRNQNGTVKSHQGIIVYQNQPNPFSEFTVVGFELPEAALTTITVYDLNSKVLYKNVLDAAKGYNQFELNTSQLGATGVLFYQLDAAGYTATKRMVVIK